MFNKQYIFYYNINNDNICLIYDKYNMLDIYILYLIDKISIYFYILNNIYIFFINNIYNIIYYLSFKIYKYIYMYINKNFNYIHINQLIINIIGLNYKLYFIEKYNYLIFQLKYSHKIILKLPKLIYCKVDINKNIIYLYSNNLILLNTIGKLIESFQCINKYKELGINLNK